MSSMFVLLSSPADLPVLVWLGPLLPSWNACCTVCEIANAGNNAGRTRSHESVVDGVV
jgi:hypothetical protein